jgi:hypothetical protein
MPYPPRAPIEPHRERLFQPLHNRRKLQPIGGLNVERQPLFRKPKPPKLEGKTPPHFANTRQKIAIACLRRNNGLRLLIAVRTSYHASCVKVLFIRILF